MGVEVQDARGGNAHVAAAGVGHLHPHFPYIYNRISFIFTTAFPLYLQPHFPYIIQVVLRADLRGQRGGRCCMGRQYAEHQLVPHPNP